jgi:glycosyltransferase involved in cell wall biosynthesis
VSSLQFSVIVPAFNEAANIDATIDRLRAYLDGEPLSWEIIIVDDGSTDDTAALVRAQTARDPRIRIVLGSHKGKGAAVKCGMSEAIGAWRFMADADLSMPPDNIGRFFSALREAPSTDILIGSREAIGSRRIGEPWRRHAAGRLFNYLAQAVGVPGIQDTQCGFKMFSADAARTLFPQTTIDGFAFDVELLFLARRAGFSIREVGIEWQCRLDSRVSLGRGIAAFGDIVRVRLNAWRGRYPHSRPPGTHWDEHRRSGTHG